MIELIALHEDDWPAWREVRLQALEEAPHAFGSTLQQWQGENDTEERWRRRLWLTAYNAMVLLDRRRAGIVSATIPGADGTVELISMYVVPFARGRGAGDALVQAVLRWGSEHNATRVVLNVKENNEHAIALYRRHGFEFIDDRTSNEPDERTMSLALDSPSRE